MNVAHPEFSTARRVALVSDTHGHLADGLAQALRAAGTDLIVHAGDVGAASVLDQLAAIAPLLAVAGNNDVTGKWPAAEERTRASLPDVIDVTLPGGRLVVVHGHQYPRVATRHQRLREAFADARAIVYGHSHRAVTETAAAPWVLNPGAAGRARAFGGAGWLRLHCTRRTWRVTRENLG